MRLIQSLKQLFWGVLLGGMFLPGIGNATCTLQGGIVANWTIPVPVTVTVPRDAVAGTVIYTSAMTPVSRRGSNLYCDTSNHVGVINGIGGQPIVGTTRFAVAATGVSFAWIPDYLAAGYPAYGIISGPASFNSNIHSMGVQLVKTAQIAAGAQVPGGVIANFTIEGIQAMTLSLSNAIRIIPQTCAVTTANVNVQLTPANGISKRLFAGVGTTSTAVPFSIGVDCTGVAATIFVTFTDQQTPANTTNTMALTATSTASGVGVQILRNGAPVNFGPDSSVAGNRNQVRIGAVNGALGVANIALSARYIQTQAIVNPGTANGLATFTMSYQ